MSGRKSTDLVGGDHGDKNQELSHGGGGGERNKATSDGGGGGVIKINWSVVAKNNIILE